MLQLSRKITAYQCKCTSVLLTDKLAQSCYILLSVEPLHCEGRLTYLPIPPLRKTYGRAYENGSSARSSSHIMLVGVAIGKTNVPSPQVPEIPRDLRETNAIHAESLHALLSIGSLATRLQWRPATRETPLPGLSPRSPLKGRFPPPRGFYGKGSAAPSCNMFLGISPRCHGENAAPLPITSPISQCPSPVEISIFERAISRVLGRGTLPHRH